MIEVGEAAFAPREHGRLPAPPRIGHAAQVLRQTAQVSIIESARRVGSGHGGYGILAGQRGSRGRT